MKPLLRRYRADLVICLGLLLLPLLLFWPVTVGGRTLLPADNLFTVEPFASAAGALGFDGVPHNKLLDDLVLENYPWKKFILESLQRGELPLWNPYQFAGQPFLASGQHSALYPFSVIFYLVPLPRAYGLFTVSQLFLAGLLMYLYLRVLGLNRLGAVFGGIVAQLCLFMVVSVVFTMILAAVIWLPLVLTALELIARRQPVLGGRPATVPWIALGAGALALQVYAGHIEITYYTLMIAGAYALWRLGTLRFGAPSVELGIPPAGERSWRLLLHRAGAMLALAGLGLGIGALQFVPYLEVVLKNFRSGSATYEQIVGWAYPARHAIAFLVPGFYGSSSHHAYFDLFTWRWTAAPLNGATIDWGIKNSVEGGAYVGLMPLLLMALLLALLARQHLLHRPTGLHLMPASFSRLAPFFVGLAGLSLAFAFGAPLYRLIFWLPGINQLHSPFRWVWPFAVCAAILGAYGVEYLQRTHQPDREAALDRHRRQRYATIYGDYRPQPLPARLWAGLRRAVTRILFLDSHPGLITGLGSLAFWGGLVVVAGLAAARWQYARAAPLMDRLVRELALADRAFADGQMFFSYQARGLLLFGLLLMASGIVLRVSRCPIYFRGRAVWQALAVAVIALDLLAAGWDFNPAADPTVLSYLPPSVEFLRQDAGLWRFTTYDPDGRKPLNANLGWYFNLQDIRGYDSIFSRQYRDYMALIQEQYELDFNRIAPLSRPEALDSPLLDLLNVKYVISLVDIANPKYTRVYSAEVQIYRNESFLPRAYLLPATATRVTDDFGAAVQQYDPRQYVLVQPGPDLPPVPSGGEGAATPTPAQPQPAAVTAYASGEVYVDAAVTQPSWLVLADSYFAGWRAYSRPIGAGQEAEQELKVRLVNGNFRGVQLPAGEWTVRFKYSPDSVKLGGIVAFIAGISLVFALGVWAWRFFYQESAVDSTARRVAKNSLAPMALNLMNRGIDLIFAAFYLRVLGPGDVGKYSFAIVVFGWFEIVTNYGLNTLLTRDVSQDRAHANRYLVNTSVLRLLLGLVAVPGLALLLGLRQLLPNPLSPDTLWAITLLVLAQIPATVATGLSALFYVYEKAEYPAAVATVSTLLKVGLGTIALVLGWGFVGLAATSGVVNLVTLAILAVLAWRLFFRPRWEPDWALQRTAMRESFPLMLNHLLATLFFKVDVPILETIRNQQQAGLGNREVGWYNTAYKFVDAFNVIPAFFTFALFPVMSRQAREDPQALGRSYALAVKLLVAVALPVAVVTSFAAPLLVGLLGGSEFLPHGALALAIMVWSIPFGWINSVTNYLLIALGQQRSLTRAFALALLFNVLLNLALIPRYGYPAAAAITIASEMFEGLAFYWYLRRALQPLPWLSLLWRLWLAAGLMAGGTFALWAVQPLLALALGGALYVVAVARLGAFSAAERALLAGILPGWVRARLRLEAAA